ncbi:MAG: carbamoyltransferase HypF [Candidatus Methanoplasma sp.]|jgi:hydrogenase maturation protein HypF|nr:carbamoyltransferase HypF [Candidatus Methanoplasma sp.]
MRIIFKGVVQGVGFRPAVHRAASGLGLLGEVRNDGSDVVVDIDDGDRFLDSFLSDLPPLAHVDEIVRIDSPPPRTDGFRIAVSLKGSSGLSIPTDVAVCGDCLKDMKKGRRSGYPFTSCTKCGPRFTLLEDLPYDRVSTAMKAFGPCRDCRKEYEYPNDRRFHHQTVCCPECGPSYRLLDKNSKNIPGDPISKFADMLAEGRIGVVKSWGGMHICCTLDNVVRMREWYRREQKPFAIMVRDENAVYKYGRPTGEEMMHITSTHRPIVLIEKRDSDTVDRISPGLDNIGIFLPYTGVQHILFEHLKDDALVMTSANVPGEPMILDDDEITVLGADMYLLHDQQITNRADDSVLRTFGDRTFFIRRSRGHIPSYIRIRLGGAAVAVGAQENLTGSVAAGGKIHPTQHIGDGEGMGVADYLEKSIKTHIRLLGCHPDIVAMDLHPGYVSRGVAKRLSEEFGSEIIEVQHHWAHAASLMVDNNTDDVVALTLDGSGYGTDGTVWGGEVLAADLSSFSRIASLEGIPLLGSEKALYDLRRLRFAIDAMNKEENHSFPEKEASVLMKMMDKSVRCSSMGRLMDSISYSLGICSARTYDGEPAMKLEPLLARGKLIPGFETENKDGIIRTANLFSRIGRNDDPADTAYSIIYNVMKCLTESAVETADSEGIGPIGITGGVSYNSAVCKMFSEMAKDTGHELIFHNNVPNGDGGVSVGQAAIALKRIR